MPNIFEDVNGQYIGMDNKIHKVRPGHHILSTFSGWDTYRTQAQLWGLLYPQAASDLCQTFLETSRQTQHRGGGGLPLWSMFNDETMIMSGYPAAPFIASAYAFGARDFDVDALTAVMIDSGKNNRYWGRSNHVTWSYLGDYKKYGYYPNDCGISHAISQNVEYAAADFSIARMCQVVGDEENHKYFLDRSHSIFNLMHPDEKYLWGRRKDGSWENDFDPHTNAGCQEGTSTHYTWGIPYSLGKLIQDMGGEVAAEARMDKLMSKIAFGYDYGNPHYLAGNEPCFGVVPVYNWIGSPWKAQQQMRRVMNESFANTPDGIPGDDDSGAMSAWYVFAALGLYPEIPGVGGFAVTGPLFPRFTIHLDGGQTIVMNAKNAGKAAPYIQSMKVDGTSFEETWLTVEQLTKQPKTTIDFTMSTEPNKSWAANYRPPSFSGRPPKVAVKKSPPKLNDEDFRLSLGASEYEKAYNLALAEIKENIRDDYFIAGHGWTQLWTRDTAYSVELGCGLLYPGVSEISLRKCIEQINGIGTCWFQDECGHFGGWPNLSDAIVGTQGAWALYCINGDKAFLSWAYDLTKNSLIRAEKEAYDRISGLFKGCSSFMESNSGYPTLYHNNGKLLGRTKALSTNMLYYNGYRIGAKMGLELGADAQEIKALNAKADQLRNAIRTRLWLPEKGYYSYYEDEHRKPVDCMEGLGESLALLAPDFETDAKRIFKKTYRANRGIPCLWPRWKINEKDIFHYYHNGRIWPFVQGYWAMAASRHKKTDILAEELKNLLWLSQQKNTFAEFYEFDGTFPHDRKRQLWSDAGYVSMIFHGLFGMNFELDQLRFAPVKPAAPFAQTITLENVKYRQMNLEIQVIGYGTQIQTFKLDGVAQANPTIPADLKGDHKIEIILTKNVPMRSKKIDNKSDYPLVQKTNPFVGTAAHGHTYPGVTLPFGMVQLSPDTGTDGWDWCSGYHYSDSSIMGFSHTHISGSGCADYGDFLFMPTIGTLQFNPGSKKNPDEGHRSRFSHDQEKALPGTYEVHLSDYGIDVQLTATKRVGVHKYTYPPVENANVIIDITHAIHGARVKEGKLEIVGDRQVRGYIRKSGWSPDRFLYFTAEFSRPFKKSGLVIDDKIEKQTKKADGTNLKAYVQFDTTKEREVLVKVSLSAVSWDGTVKNLKAECSGWDFSAICDDAMKTWEKQLSKITIKGGYLKDQRVFYSALYHACLAPNVSSDVDGQYRGMDKKIHKADNFDNYTVFSLWDTFRAEHPLMTIIEQHRTNDFINSLLGKYEQRGILPFWELASDDTRCMIGYHAIPVIADAWVKNIRGFDVPKAFKAMKHSAMQDHQGLMHYKKLGFIPMEAESNSVSRTVEYAYDDWCIAMMAKGLGNQDEYARFTARSQFYRNLFDPSVGFMRGKSATGVWNPEFDPDKLSPWGAGEFTEGNSWHYTFFVPHDVEGLIELMGGEQKFINKLDELFTHSGHEHMDVSGLIGQYAHGNEPCHNFAYLYSYAGAAWKTQEKIAQIVRTLYSDQPEGFCGNEDCGQMSAWYVFSAMGFYPVCPGLPIYVFGTPLFPEVSIHLENGNRFDVIAENVSDENIYIQSVKLNGKPYGKTYLQHADIINGGKIVFQMGSKPNKQWAQKKENRPYSEPGDPVTQMPYVYNAQTAFLENAAVEIHYDDDSATIYYSTDGSDPDPSSQKYDKPFFVDKTTTVKARAYRERAIPSVTMEVTYKKVNLCPAMRPESVEKGMNYSYYEGDYTNTADMIRSKPKQTGICDNFDISISKRDEKYGFEFSGYFKAPQDGIYQFWTRSDDGSCLYINSQLIVNNDGHHGARDINGFAALKAGYHQIKVLYFNGSGGGVLDVSVIPPEGKKERINSVFRTAVTKM